MKLSTKIQAALLPAIMIAECVNAQSASYHITGTADSSLNGNTINVSRIDGNVGMFLGTDTITDGTFSFNITIEDVTEDMKLGLRWENIVGLPLFFYAEPDTHVVINGIGYGANLATWKVESSDPRQPVMNRFAEAIKKQLDRRNELLIEDTSYSYQMRNTPDEETRNVLRHRMDSIQNIVDVQRISADSILIGLMRQMTPESSYLLKLFDMSSNLLYIDTYPYRNEIEELYTRLPEDLKTTDEGETIFIALYPPKVMAPGDSLPAYSLFDLEGNTHQLSEFYGKHILIDFWSEGCLPCIMSFPELSEIAETYRDKLHVVKINVNNDKMWRGATTRYGVTGNNFRDPKERNGLFTNAGEHAVPTYMLINPDGTVKEIWSGYGEGSLKSRLQEYISR